MSALAIPATPLNVRASHTLLFIVLGVSFISLATSFSLLAAAVIIH
jgi:hypothetical protein